jgi:opacity protein-like surface antigen
MHLMRIGSMNKINVGWWLVLFASATISVSAQGGGIKGLIGLSKLSFEEIEIVTDEEAKISLQGGGFYSIPLVHGSTVNLYLQPELYYASENSTVNLLLQATGTAEKVNTNTQSVYLPMLLRIGFLDPSAVQIGVFAGPHARYAMSSKVTPETQGLMLDIPEFPDVNKMQWGLTFGVDIALARALIVDLRYNYGLSPAYESATETQEGSARSTALLLGIGFFF